MAEYEIDKIAFENKEPDRGYTIKIWYLKEPSSGDSLIEIFKEGDKVRNFLFPAYIIWNLVAHFSDIVDSEINGDFYGYKIAASTGFKETKKRGHNG